MKKLQTTNYPPASTATACRAGKLLTSKKGFTLIEMLVVIFIMGMISTVSIVNFRAAEKQKRVVLASETVINAFRNAQNFILTGKNNNGSTSSCQIPVSYYTHVAYPSQIILNGIFRCSDGTTVDTTIETYPLPINTRIQASGLKVNGVVNNVYLNIVFSPPFGAMTVSGDVTPAGTFNTVTITLESTDSAITRTVTIDGVAGRIGE